MDIWSILGIAPTSDMQALKAAYHKKLAVTHPEEKPEEFQQLRTAYEKAQSLAKQTMQDTGDGSPLANWTNEMKAIYNNFSRRIDVNQWQQLLQQEVSFSLASRAQAEEALLRFLMDEYYLPHAVWIHLNQFFDFTGHPEELRENYPEGFLDRVVYPGIHHPDYVRYEYFSECFGTEPDDYLHQYFRTESSIREGTIEEAEQELQTLRQMPAKHPFTSLLTARLLIRQENVEKAHELMSATLEKYPDNDNLQLITADCARMLGRHSDSSRLYDAILTENPEHNSALYGRAQSSQALGLWEKATDDYAKLIRKFPSDRHIQEKENEVYRQWAEELEGLKAQGATLTNRQILDLVWCYIECNRHEEGLALIEAFTATDLGEEYEKQNSAGNLSMALERYEDALRYAKGWEASILAIPEDTPDKELADRRERLPRSYEMQAVALHSLGRIDEAFALQHKALEITPGEPRIWRTLFHWHMQKYDYEAAFDPAKKLWDLLPGDAIGPYLLCVAQFANLDHREALYSIEEALSRDRSNFDFYVYKIRILMFYKKDEDARKILDMLGENGLQGHVLTFLNARWDQMFGNDTQRENAFLTFRSLLAEPELEMGFAEEVYFAASLDKSYNQQQQLKLMEKGIRINPHHYDLMNRLTWMYNELEMYDKAIILAEECLARYPFATNQKYRLARAYAERSRYREAAELYVQTANSEDDGEDWYYAGRNYYYAGDHVKARECLLKAIELDDNNPYAYRWLSTLERDENHPEEAIAAAKNSIGYETKEDRIKYHWRHLARILQHYGRLDEAFEAWRTYARSENTLEAYSKADSVRENQHKWDIAFEARTEYFKRNTTQKDKDEYLVELAWTCLRQNDLPGMRKHLKKLRTTTEAEEYQLAMAYYNLAARHYSEAYSWWRKIPSSMGFSRRNNVFLMMLKHLEYDEQFNTLLEEKLKVAKTWGHDGWGDAGEEKISYCVRAEILYWQGEFDEGDAVLAKAEGLRLCHNCRCTDCKDLLTARALKDELQGSYEAALAFWQEQYRQRGANEDYVLHILRLENLIRRKKYLG